MKTNKLFFGAFALLLAGLASCSDEEPVVNPTSSSSVVDGSEKYMSVVITSAGDNGSRADRTDPDQLFSDGVGTECDFTAKDVLFLFFDEKGNPFPLAAANVEGTTTSNAVVPSEISEVEHGPGGATLTKAQLVLGKAMGQGYVGKTPSEAICIINNEGRFDNSAVTNLPKSTVIAKTASLPEVGLDGNSSKFMMSNSVYVNHKGETMQSIPLAGYFFDSAAEASAKPVTIYVERVVAKVRVTGLGTYPAQVKDATTENKAAVKNYNVDNEEIPLKVELTGWKIRNTTPSNFVIKQVNKTAFDTEFPTWEWNDSLKHRCYWTAPQNPTDLQNVAYDIFAAEGELDAVDNKNWLGSMTATGDEKDPSIETTDATNVEYCLENTLQPQSATDRNSYATGIVVRGVVKADLDKDGNFEPVDLIRWAGAYYTLDEFKKLAVNSYNTQYNTSYTAADVVIGLTADNNNYYMARVKTGSGTQPIPNFDKFLYWVGGVTSYYVNIEHSIGSTADKKLYGVVRNHIYHYAFDGVIGLGIPGNSTTVDEETESFLSAKLYCLNWRVVKNTVTLE